MAIGRTTSQSGESDDHTRSTFPGTVSGTYLQVIVHEYEEHFDFPPDVQHDVIYLLASGRFAWLNNWPGYHYGRRAGWFTRLEADIALEGRDTLWSDCISANHADAPFTQHLQLKQREWKRMLRGPEGDYLYLGSRVFIPFKGWGRRVFPQSWDELEQWVTRFVQPRAT